MSRRFSRRQFLFLGGLATAALLSKVGRPTPPAFAPFSWAKSGVAHDQLSLSAADLAGGHLQGIRLKESQLELAGAPFGTCVSPILRSPWPFSSIAPILQRQLNGGSIDISVRVSPDGLLWGDWQAVQSEAAPSATDVSGREFGSLLGIFGPPLPAYCQAQITLRAAVNGSSPTLSALSLVFFDVSAGPTTDAAAASLALSSSEANALGLTRPPIISRSAWGCPDGQGSPKWPWTYRTVSHLFIHHTATANNQHDWAAVVRSIWSYHANYLDWGDIGYNFLVDPNGYLYEGRAGGDDVIAGHTYGYNDGTLGLAFLGTFSSYAPPSSMVGAAESLLAWKAAQRGIDPTGIKSFVSYPSCPAVTVAIPTILGHRDAPGHSSYNPCNLYGATECPGNVLESNLPAIRTDVRNKLSDLAITGVAFTPRTVVAGNLLRVDITVVNNGGGVAATQGPSPGYHYNQGDSFSPSFPSILGDYRVGVDFSGRAQVEDHPYRWGLGSSLAPGASVVVTGYIRVSTLGSADYWAGLVQEAVAWRQDVVGTQTIAVVAAPQVAFDPVVTSKTWFVLTWRGSGGIGSLSYVLELSTDSSIWKPWITTAGLRALFVGNANQTYYFRARAIDSAGNLGPYVTFSVRTGADSSGLNNVTPIQIRKND